MEQTKSQKSHWRHTEIDEKKWCKAQRHVENGLKTRRIVCLIADPFSEICLISHSLTLLHGKASDKLVLTYVRYDSVKLNLTWESSWIMFQK